MYLVTKFGVFNHAFLEMSGITVLIFRVLTCRRDIPVFLNIIISTLLSPKDVNNVG